ncbi:MAG: hypothetical protein AB7O26_14015, partial [Planctomycetaceae bacterium]
RRGLAGVIGEPSFYSPAQLNLGAENDGAAHDEKRVMHIVNLDSSRALQHQEVSGNCVCVL